MENQKSSATQIMLNYGLMLGLASILISVANYSFGNAYEPHWSINVISLIVMAVIVVLGIKKLKEQNGGFLKLGEALKVGLGISLISAILAVIYTYVFVTFIEPDFFKTIGELQVEKWIDAGMTDEAIENATGMMEKMAGIGFTAAFMLIGTLFFGFIISLIGGLVMKQSDEEITSI